MTAARAWARPARRRAGSTRGADRSAGVTALPALPPLALARADRQRRQNTHNRTLDFTNTQKSKKGKQEIVALVTSAFRRKYRTKNLER